LRHCKQNKHEGRGKEEHHAELLVVDVIRDAISEGIKI